MTERAVDQRDIAIEKLFKSLWILIGGSGCSYSEVSRILESTKESMCEGEINPWDGSVGAIDTECTLLLSDILAIWHDQVEYVDEFGSPLPLAEKTGSPSLLDIYQKAAKANEKASKKMPFEAAIKKLVEGETIEDDGNRVFRATRYAFPTRAKDFVGAMRNLDLLADFAGTVAYNATAEKDILALNVASVTGVDASKMPVIKSMLNDQGMVVLRELHDFMQRNKVGAARKHSADISVAMFVVKKNEKYEKKEK